MYIDNRKCFFDNEKRKYYDSQKGKGYILLTDTGTLFTKLIKLYTKKPYNHASIAFDSKLSVSYSFGRKSVRNPFIGGFVIENIESSSLFDKSECAIYSFDLTDLQSEKMKRYIRKIDAQKEQYSYNFLGLFGFIIRRPIKRKKLSSVLSLLHPY